MRNFKLCASLPISRSLGTTSQRQHQQQHGLAMGAHTHTQQSQVGQVTIATTNCRTGDTGHLRFGPPVPDSGTTPCLRAATRHPLGSRALSLSNHKNVYRALLTTPTEHGPLLSTNISLNSSIHHAGESLNAEHPASRSTVYYIALTL